jgi:hypothetical protein
MARRRTCDVTERELKRCPECAEDVLAEARKCRYCGYRFDARRAGGASLLSFLLPQFKQTSEHLRPSELLADWGVELAPGEEVKVLAVGRVSARHGYLVVTDRRVAFVEHAGTAAYHQLFDWPIETIVDIETTGRLRRRLTVRGAGYEIAVRGLGRDATEQVREHLTIPSAL